jgi:hypothetical protein
MLYKNGIKAQAPRHMVVASGVVTCGAIHVIFASPFILQTVAAVAGVVSQCPKFLLQHKVYTLESLRAETPSP